MRVINLLSQKVVLINVNGGEYSVVNTWLPMPNGLGPLTCQKQVSNIVCNSSSFSNDEVSPFNIPVYENEVSRIPPVIDGLSYIVKDGVKRSFPDRKDLLTPVVCPFKVVTDEPHNPNIIYCVGLPM